MESTAFVDPFKAEDVFGNNLDDFDIWDEGEDFNPKNNVMQEFDSAFFAEGAESSAVPSSEEPPSQESDSPPKPQRRRSSRRASTKKPSLRRKLSKPDLAVDENEESSSVNERSLNSKGSSQDKSASHHEMGSPKVGSPSKSERKSSRSVRSSKSPSRRRPSSAKKEASMRNLVATLNKSNPDVLSKKNPDVQEGLEAGGELGRASGPVVSKSVRHRGETRTRPKSMREMKTEQVEQSNKKGVENNLPDTLPESSEKAENKSEPVRGKIERSNSIRARSARLAAAEGQIKDGAKPSRRGDPTRSRLGRTKSMNQREDGRPVPRPTLSGGGLPGRSASFAIRRNRSGDAALDGVSKSKLAAMAAAHENQRGEGEGRPAARSSQPGRGLSGRRSASFAIRSERAANFSALDDVMKSKLATLSGSQGEKGNSRQAASIPGRGLGDRRSASFAIRRERAGNHSALDDVMKSKVETISGSMGSQGNGRQAGSIPGRGLGGSRRSASFAIRKERVGNHSALDDVMKSKLETIAGSKGEQPSEQAAPTPREPSLGNLGRSASSSAGRRLPPPRHASHSGKGLQRTSRSGESLQRTSSVRF